MNNQLRHILLTLATTAITASAQTASNDYPFRNTRLTNEERVENLLTLLTPEEKVGLMMNKSVSVDRLGIPSYNWWSEACHGVRQNGYTVYPQNIGMAATFNSQLIYDVFTTVSDEARANWNRSKPVFNVPMGVTNYPGNPELTFWCPNVNIVRDPRWGRGQETLGEDPFLSAVMGVQTVLGMQGNDDKYYKTHACAKHYAVHSGPEPMRHRMDVCVSGRDLWETYLPAFKALVEEAHVREVMCAYQRYEGVPCCTSDRLLVDILRNKWHYDGIVLTDCDAINNFYNKGQHETHPDAKSASVDAVLHGTDLECGRSFQSLVGALKEGLIKESDLDFHLRRTLLGRFQLGMFDPAETLPWAGLGEDVISSEKHHQLAVQTARESIVLLKNDGVLPLSKTIKRIAVVGPNADQHDMLYGNYGGTPSNNHKFSLLHGIRQALPDAEVIYEKGCDLLDDFRRGNRQRAAVNVDSIAALVAHADAIVFIGGITAGQEGEGGDRRDIEFPRVQGQLLKALHATGKPVVLVNCSGSAMAFTPVLGDCNAIVQAWYPGQGGSQALAEILFGDYNPSAKLPVTFYKSTADLPEFTNYDMENRTYRYFTGEPLYAFGYGLSYTKYEYGKAKLSHSSVKAGKGVSITVPVKNVGERAGEAVVQVYVKSLDNPDAPIKSLKGFAKVSLAAGKSAKVKIELPATSFEYYREGLDGLAVYSGRYQILYGSSSADNDLKAIDFKVI